MKVSIVGSGVVGTATGIGFNKQGHEVIFYDVNKEKLSMLEAEGHTVTEEITEAIDNSNVSFICVPTPFAKGKIDLSYLESATISIGEVLRIKKGYHAVVVRSTVLPYTTRTNIIPLLEKHSRLKAGRDFGVCVNPGFLRQVNALPDFLNPSRIVIGELDMRSGDLLERLYTRFKAPTFRTDLDTAEMIKYVANCFLSTKISFFNEIYIICKNLGLNPHFISEVVSLDPRIGKYGVYGGQPFGGKCLPKDLKAFINFVHSKKLNPKLLNAVLYINEEIAHYHDQRKINERD